MLKRDPLISVIIPCYNVEKFVTEAIYSIINQTYQNLEIWIIDDASTDSTLQVINSFTDVRIKIESYNQNTQKIGAVNDVLQKVNGAFIAFQDADDWSEPERLEKQLKYFLEDNSLGICFTNYYFIANKNFLPNKISLTNEELKNEFLNYTYKDRNGLTSTCCPSMMISKQVLTEEPGYNKYFIGRVAEDVEWIYRIFKKFKGITVNEVLYNYRIRQGSFSQLQSSGTRVKYAYSWQLLSKIIGYNEKEGIDLFDTSNKSILRDIELEACELALSEKILELNQLKLAYENSNSFKLGKLLLKPFSIFKRKG